MNNRILLYFVVAIYYFKRKIRQKLLPCDGSDKIKSLRVKRDKNNSQNNEKITSVHVTVKNC